jgi:ADP-ribose pyrophosphatase
MSDADELIWQKAASWRLVMRTAVLPDGTAHRQPLVEHPGAVVLIPLRPAADGWELLLIRQYRRALQQEILELPAGTRGWEEDWRACAQRELREETGFRAARLTFLGEIWPTPGISDELMQLYLAQELTPDPLPGDVDEQITVTPLPLETAVAMAEDGRLQDAKSIVGILRAARFLRRDRA